ncbi:hypothetical protein G9A89_004288 [Geosiphon pyriformis]|nr:hypothetical protein G9A89_004288 [Geosiphon pyriformis]
MDTPKEMIVAALAEFGKIKSIKIQLIGLWQKAMVEFAKIGQAVQLAAKWSFLIGKNSVLDLVCCERCEFLGHSALECGAPLAFTPKFSKIVKKVTSVEHCLWLAKLYAKKTVLISHPATFGGKFLFSSTRIFSVISALPDDSALHNHLSSLECFLELLTDQVSDILRKLSNVELVPLASLPLVSPPIASTSLAVDIDLDITLNDALIHFIPLSVVVTNTVADISLTVLRF